jgi:dihydroflavonol-4-reductase
MTDSGTVMVTGGTGQIGRHLVRELSRIGCRVRVLSRADRNPWADCPNVSIIQGDISDAGLLKQWVQGCDTVFHLAVYNNACDVKPDMFDSINVQGTASLVRSCCEQGVKTVVNVSSAVVYAATGRTARDETWELRKNPRSDNYTRTKQESLLNLRKFVRDKECTSHVVTVMPTAVLDLSVSACPAPDSKIQKFLWENLGGGIPGGLVNRVGCEDRLMNLVFVEDLVQGIILAAKLGRHGEEYILGGQNLTAAEYLARMSKRFGRNPPLLRIPLFIFKLLNLIKPLSHRIPMISIIAEGCGDDRAFSSAKAKRELGYDPKTEL